MDDNTHIFEHERHAAPYKEEIAALRIQLAERDANLEIMKGVRDQCRRQLAERDELIARWEKLLAERDAALHAAQRALLSEGVRIAELEADEK